MEDVVIFLEQNLAHPGEYLAHGPMNDLVTSLEQDLLMVQQVHLESRAFFSFNDLDRVLSANE